MGFGTGFVVHSFCGFAPLRKTGKQGKTEVFENDDAKGHGNHGQRMNTRTQKVKNGACSNRFCVFVCTGEYDPKTLSVDADIFENIWIRVERATRTFLKISR